MGERKVSGGSGWVRILWRIREMGSVVVDVGAGRRDRVVLGESVGAGRRGGLLAGMPTRELPEKQHRLVLVEKSSKSRLQIDCRTAMRKKRFASG